jgi:hypothetical protein
MASMNSIEDNLHIWNDRYSEPMPITLRERLRAQLEPTYRFIERECGTSWEQQ